MEPQFETGIAEPATDGSLAEATSHFQAAADTKKCWACGCLRHSLDAIEQSLSEALRPASLDAAISQARARLAPQKYDCLGCDICYPAVGLNALAQAGLSLEAEVCPTEQVEERAGWPPLPGSFRVLRYHAPVAICVLTSDALVGSLATLEGDAVAILGSLQTENLGVERLISNVVANPHIRFLIVCGEDSQKAVGHLPGQALVALASNGIDEKRRIIGAKGKRPVLRNLSDGELARFRATVEVVDLVGMIDRDRIAEAVEDCSKRDPGPAPAFEACRAIAAVAGSVPHKMTADPSGYFVLFPDAARRLLCLEHYANNGVLTTIIEGKSAPELYMTAIERGLLSRLDHAAYLGRELARAENALREGEPYVQDAAAEICTPDCACHHSTK